MANILVPNGTTLTTRQTMQGADTLTVDLGGAIAIPGGGDAQAVRLQTTSVNGASILNNGAISNAAADGRAIQFRDTLVSPVNATINNGATGIITSDSDALQIQGTITSGTVTVTNAVGGLIESATGQGIDFAGGQGAFITQVINSGTIRGVIGDAIRAGGVGNITNHGVINGGSSGANSGNADGITYSDNATGTVININDTGTGSISADRHGINAGVGSNITVNNGTSSFTGATITGRNGSGVGADGSATVVNYGTITGGFTPGADTHGHTPGQPNGGPPDGIDDGDGDGIDIDFFANIDNFGTIQGIGSGGNGSDGLPNTSEGIAAGGGTFTNHAGATIQGVGLGMLIDNSSQGNAPFLTTIINDGSISGGSSFGIRIVSVLNDTIDNAGTISGGGGVAIQFGGGDNTLRIRTGSSIVGITQGGLGNDTVDYTNFGSGAAVDLSLATQTATGTGGLTGFESAIGSAFADSFKGSAANNFFNGLGGTDTVILTGSWLNYTIAGGAPFVLTDTRAGSPDGTDTIQNVENFQFSNGTFTSAQILNDAPTAIALSGAGVAESSANATVVGTLSATDADAPLGDTQTFTLLDNAGGRFALSGATITVANGALLDFETATSHAITVRVQDAKGLTFDKVINVAVTNVNEGPPIVTSNGGGDNAAVSIPENTTAVTTVTASDPDADTTLTYSIVGGADAAKFQIDPSSGVLSFLTAPNFELPGDADHNNSYIVQVRASDGSLSGDQVITVNVTDVAEKPHWTASIDVGAHPAGWLPSGIGDFNGDATSDLAWYNASTNSIDIWKLSNGQWAGSADTGVHPAGYQPAGFGDLNHDGTSDILWFNATTRDVDLWKVSNGQWAGSVDIGTHPAGYALSGVGDFDGDGTGDVLWYNATTRDIDIWKISNGQWAGSVDVGLHPAGYQPSLVGDFNGDGTSDIAWYNSSTGDVDIWKLSNGQWAGSVDVGPHPSGWQPLGTGDFNQDGASDIAWYNPTTNNIDIWLIKNGQWAGSVDVGTHPAGAVAVGVGDFDHNGVSDIAWRDTTTGHIDNWMLAYS